MREFRDFEAMINIEIVVIGIQFFFLSFFFYVSFCLQFVNLNSPPFS